MKTTPAAAQRRALIRIIRKLDVLADAILHEQTERRIRRQITGLREALGRMPDESYKPKPPHQV